MGVMNTATDTPTTFQSSELSRNSASVFAAAEEQPITVTRRDGETLVLMSERESSARDRLFEFAAQIIAATTDDQGSLAERMADRFPWMLALSAEDRVVAAADLVRAARASFATRQAHLALAEVYAWRETAEAIAAGLGSGDVEWLDDEDVVERP